MPSPSAIYSRRVLCCVTGRTTISKHLLSGCLSFVIIVLLATFFVTNIISFANKSDINLSEIATQSTDPSYFSSNTEKFLFAIGVISILLKLSAIDLNNDNRYFNINVTTVSVINGTKTNPILNMQPCTLDQWSKFGDSFAALYLKL